MKRICFPTVKNLWCIIILVPPCRFSSVRDWNENRVSTMGKQGHSSLKLLSPHYLPESPSTLYSALERLWFIRSAASRYIAGYEGSATNSRRPSHILRNIRCLRIRMSCMLPLYHYPKPPASAVTLGIHGHHRICKLLGLGLSCRLCY